MFVEFVRSNLIMNTKRKTVSLDFECFLIVPNFSMIFDVRIHTISVD